MNKKTSRIRSINRKRFLFKSFSVVILLLVIILQFLQFKYTVNKSNTILQNQSLVHTITVVQQQITDPLKVKSIRCVVFTFGDRGRFGNSLFQIASAYGLAHLHSCHLYLPPSLVRKMRYIFVFDLQQFLISHMTFKFLTKKNPKLMTKITKDVVCQYVPELTRPNAIPPGHVFHVKGFWKSYLHFAKYGDDLRERIFVGTKPVLEKVSTLFIDIYKKRFNFTPQFSLDKHQRFKKQLAESDKATWIGIHIRRLDFTQLKFSSSDEYVLNAIEYFTTRFSNAHFIVASDDKSHCENLFQNRSNIFITPDSFLKSDDLITLSLCQHSIITGGTFGWWAAFLANGLVIHDKVYASGCERREYYYPPWFLINGNVRAYAKSNYSL